MTEPILTKAEKEALQHIKDLEGAMSPYNHDHTGDFFLKNLKKRILKDGMLTLREANKWYRYGNGESLTVDASKVDLDFVNPDDYSKIKFEGVQTLGRSRDGLVYGEVSVKNLGNGQLEIKADRYDFEMHEGSSFKTKFRNFATKIGALNAGKGTPYKIYFKGENTPNYRRNIPR